MVDRAAGLMCIEEEAILYQQRTAVATRESQWEQECSRLREVAKNEDAETYRKSKLSREENVGQVKRTKTKEEGNRNAKGSPITFASAQYFWILS